jgi:hypothetical protein
MLALRIFVSISATGSETLIALSYQLDFVTPGIIPSLASFRKQTLHIWNFRMYPRGRPHTRHRFTRRVEYFGVRCALIINDFFATPSPYL